eukprot:7246650-Prymnesium_polylepis.2
MNAPPTAACAGTKSMRLVLIMQQPNSSAQTPQLKKLTKSAETRRLTVPTFHFWANVNIRGSFHFLR